MRSAVRNVVEPTRLPVVDGLGPTWLDLLRRSRPAFDQLALKFAIVRRQQPVAPFAEDLVAALGPQRRGDAAGIRPQCRSESLVGPLMTVDQFDNESIARLFGRAGNPP